MRSRANFNNALGVPLTLCELGEETRSAVVEVGASRRGEIADLCELARPTAAVLTGVGHAHVGTFGGVAALRAAKRELLDAVPADGFAVVNGDDPGARDLADDAPRRVLLAGTTAGCDVRAVRGDGAAGTIPFRIGETWFPLHAVAAHTLPLAACAVAVGRELGLSDAGIAAGLARFRPPPGRCAATAAGGVAVIDDSYNAAPEAFLAAVRTLAEFPVAPGGRRWLAAGGMNELGEEAERLHARVGAAIAAAGFDRVLFVGDRGAALAAAAGVGEHLPDAAAATAELLADLRRGDAVLVKGCRADGLERVVAGVSGGLRERAEDSG